MLKSIRFIINKPASYQVRIQQAFFTQTPEFEPAFILNNTPLQIYLYIAGD